MRKEYDFSKMKGQNNPYVKDLKTQITIRLDKETVEYFKGLAEKTCLPYQNLMNLYLRECVEMKKRPTVRFQSSSVTRPHYISPGKEEVERRIAGRHRQP